MGDEVKISQAEFEEYEMRAYYEKLVTNLTDGSHFGEIAVLTKMKRTATVRAVDYSTISSLSQDAIVELQTLFPTLVN